jgi:hypothetical protein
MAKVAQDNAEAPKISLPLSFALRCDQSNALLLLRVVAKTPSYVVMKLGKGMPFPTFHA